MEKKENVNILLSNKPEEKNIRSGKIYDTLFDTILKDIRKKFEEKIKELDDIKFLIFIDYYLGDEEEIWQKRIKKVFSDNLITIYKKEIEKREIFRKEITNDTYEKVRETFSEVFDIYLRKCVKEIKMFFNDKEYNKETGLNCLEHLIRNLNPEAITEDNADVTVKKIIEYKLILNKGIINENLFKECFINENDKEKQILKQNILFKIKEKNKVNKFKEINELSKFKINFRDSQIPKVNASFYDLSKIYQEKGYNNLSKDFTFYILENLKTIIKMLLNFKDGICTNFYNLVKTFIENEIEEFLQKKIFSKYNKKSMENMIVKELSKKEEEKFSEIIKESSKE